MVTFSPALPDTANLGDAGHISDHNAIVAGLNTLNSGKLDLSTFTAKGSLIIGTAGSTPGTLTLGTDNYVLIADATQATGVKWGQVPTAGIADGAVTSAKIADLTIVNADISASAAIDKTKIAGTAVTVADSGTVTSAMIANGTITGADIASATITGSNLVNDTITATQIAANAVGSSELADNAVDTAAVADAAITTAKVADAAITPAKMARQVGNLLTENQASVETDTTGWGSSGATIARSTAQALHGSASLLVTATGTTTAQTNTPLQAVEAGATYTAMVSALRGVGSRGHSIEIAWYTAADAYISSAVSPHLACATWTQLSVTAVAPATAAKMRLYVSANTGSTSDTFYLDCASFHKGTGGQWALPGTPILGLTDAPIGNLLTLNQATGTDATGTTDGFTPGSHCNLTSGGTAGSRYLLVTATGAGCRVHMYGGITSGTMPVTPGDTYTFRALAKSDTVTKRFRLSIYWWTSAGNVAASTARSDGPDTAMSTSYKDIGFTAVAPANAAYCSLISTRSDGDVIAGDTFHLRAFSFHRGAAGQWSLPGVPVPGQGAIKANGAVELPGGDYSPEGVVTANPGSTFLQTSGAATETGMLSWRKATGTGNTGWVAEGALADTGWRDVSASLTNGWTGALHVRRVGSLMEVLAHGLNAASATSGVPYMLPAGFRPGASSSSIRGIWYKTDLTLRRINIDTAGALTIASYAAGDVLYGSASGLVQTSNGWPSSLPGSAWP